MKAKSKPPPDDPEQSARFVETAKATGADGKAFTRAIKAIVPTKPRKRAKRAKRVLIPSSR
jgi:hypothetical protein